MLQADTDNISAERKFDLELLVQAMHDLYKNTGQISINVICTHNSRRSQLGQLWFELAAHHFHITPFAACSGGTEATAFNHRMVSAIQSHGIKLQEVSGGENPRYALQLTADTSSEQSYFSKTYDDPENPSADYIAMIVCDSADEKCPIIIGATQRLFIPYLDPKQADDTTQESEVYRAKVKEMGTDIIYAMGQLSQIL